MAAKRDRRRKRRKQRRVIPAQIALSTEKAPKEASRVAPSKSVPAVALKPSRQKMQLDISMADREGHWSWGIARDWGEDVWLQTIEPFLNDYIQKTWGQIDAEFTGAQWRRPKHISYEFSVIKREAVTRLEELQIDDFAPDIFRFRIAGRKRLYGFRINPKFYLLWYDPTHEIIRPSHK